jgi:hypothetical protein
MRLHLLFAVVFLLAGTVSATFTRSHLYVIVQLNPDGGADVREELRFFMDSSGSIDLYRIYSKSTNDISGWKSLTGLTDIRYHVDTSVVQVSDTNLRPLEPDTCSVEHESCYGTFVLEYKVNSPAGDRGIVEIAPYIKPRLTQYSFTRKALMFETTILGETYLPEYTTLEIRLPPVARLVTLNPRSVEYPEDETIPPTADKFTWQGKVSLAGFELKFEKKETLLSEVNEFFSSAQQEIGKWLMSREGITLSIAAVILIVAYILLQRRS